MVSYSLVFLVLVAASAVDALKCYECNSRNDTACANEKPPDTLKKDCSEHPEGSKYILCRKIVQTIEYEVNGLKPDTRIIRSCGWDSSSHVGTCYQRSGFGGRQEVCTCTEDLCNSASVVSLPILLVVLVTILTRFL